MKTIASSAAPMGQPVSGKSATRRKASRALYAAMFIIMMISACALLPFALPWNDTDVDIINRLQGPAWGPHLAGTDELGRDVLARLLIAGRISLSVGVAAMPYMMHLNGETGETINLTVLDGAEIVFVSRVVGSHLLSTGVIIGTRLPAYATATGLAMMSVLDGTEVERLLQISDLRSFTPATVYKPKTILERLKMARSTGYVLSVGDYLPNDISLSAPIVSRTGGILGGISLSVSIDRYTAKDAEAKFAKLVSTAAKSILVWQDAEKPGEGSPLAAIPPSLSRPGKTMAVPPSKSVWDLIGIDAPHVLAPLLPAGRGPPSEAAGRTFRPL